MPMMKHYEMLRNVSRTFALSIEQLPLPVRDVVTIAYLMFRVSDCLEDHDAMLPDRKAGLLRLWAEVLQGQVPVEKFLQGLSDIEAKGDPEIELGPEGFSQMFTSLSRQG